MRTMRQSLPYRPTYNDMVIKAVAMALAEHPEVSVALDGESIVTLTEHNIGLAVGLPGSLIVPVVRGAQALSLKEITAKSSDLVAKAQEGKLNPDEAKDGTFTVTSLGSLPIDEFNAIINPPESAILAVGRIAEKPSVVEGRIEVQPQMALTLSVDHRIINGLPAAQFLARIKDLLEQGYPLLG